ncbi:MAG: ABC transporter permease [Nitrospirae bacterium]|nr:ABC transporter permease [Nitrospirota bacterium]
MIPLLFGITFITFSLTKALPGDPVYSIVGERSSPEIIEKIRREIGADKSMFRQYAGYISLLLQGELGRSYYTNRKVADDVGLKFPNTLLLAFAAMVIAVPIGVLLGFIAALHKGRAADRIITMLSVFSISMPVFWSGLLLMLLFSLRLKVLPPSGTGGLQYLVLPAITLSLPALATLIRITRITVLDVIDMQFIRTARAKGLTERAINAIHIMKNALIPVITVIGLEFGSYLNGAVLTETIFGWDGIGRYAMEGIIKRDYPVIMGCLLVGTIIFVIMNLIVDIIYHYADPRVRVHGTDR